jgi:hypothetical protein
MDPYSNLIAHLKVQRDHLDQIIQYLEATRDYNAKNSMVALNPAANGAAPAAVGTFRTMTIGDAPQPPKLPVIQ